MVTRSSLNAGAQAFEDAELSLVGHVQAKKFAHTWVPLLSAKAAEGKLLMVVSPFVRTCVNVISVFLLFNICCLVVKEF